MPKAKPTIDELVESVRAITVVDEFHEMQRDPATGRILADGDGEPLWIAKELHPTAFKGERPDQIIVSAEDGGLFAGYYGRYETEAYQDPWVHDAILAWAKEHDYEVDWRDPGSVLLYPA